MNGPLSWLLPLADLLSHTSTLLLLSSSSRADGRSECKLRTRALRAYVSRIGNYALGSSYIALPWWCGQVFFNQASFNPTVSTLSSTGSACVTDSLLLQVAFLTILYSWAGLGIAIVNDFKSIEVCCS